MFLFKKKKDKKDKKDKGKNSQISSAISDSRSGTDKASQPATSVSDNVEIRSRVQDVKVVAHADNNGSQPPSPSPHPSSQSEKHNLALAESLPSAQAEPQDDSAQSSSAWPVSIGALGRPAAQLPADPQQLVVTPVVISSTHAQEASNDARSPHTTAPPESSNLPPAYTSIQQSPIPQQSIHTAAISTASASTTSAYALSQETPYSPASTNTSTAHPYSPTPATVATPQTGHTGTSSYQNSPLPPLPPLPVESPPHQAYHTPTYPPQQQQQQPVSYPMPHGGVPVGMYHSAPTSMPTGVPTSSWPTPQQQPYGAVPQQPYGALQQQPYGASQPQPYGASPQQPYGATTQQHYGHKPFVMPGSAHQTYPIIMAIDWGTTYSSMAYAYQQDGEVHEVSTWPKQSHNYPKVPTCNLYAPDSKEILEWGYPAKLAMTKPPFKHHILLSKYKLHLDESSGAPPPLPNGLTVVDAIADYLRLFHAHVVQHHIQYCLSVPAMWSDHAKALMRQAALQAGMITPLDPPHRLLLISEPEAAALYCEKKCDQFSIGHGQRFMICDAGGGTVDLIVFEVHIGPQGRTLREVTRGSGHSCGSVFLDERMESLLRQKFSKWQEKGLTNANWSSLMENFIHNVKPLFDGIEDQYITMPAVPGRADMTDYDIGLEEGVLTLNAEEMRREVFDPVVDDVLRLIHNQLQQTGFLCHAIFLVGGFGCSQYLHTRVRSEFGAKVGLIAVPPRAELAVVRGAALAGIMPRVVAARVARRWYGVDALMAYEQGYDMPHKQMRDHEGQLRAKDRFSVYVAPGQQVGVDQCITKRYITYQYPDPVHSPLYACSSMDLPRYVDSPLVEKICDFTIPLPHVPGARRGYKMTFELRMYFGATEIRAEAEVNGMVVSTRCQFAG
ncbi:Heat shock 70 kDa protein 12A [Mortierella alpina]|uniref:Heat shock 70 kDa protein 12A n=1 Tax=Mortierella alpina TaxID=64518 RepID=A0A9P6JBD2_MORAP|nr:Heat shock 70 kDa protein 12A [Mortierella alpina]